MINIRCPARPFLCPGQAGRQRNKHNNLSLLFCIGAIYRYIAAFNIHSLSQSLTESHRVSHSSSNECVPVTLTDTSAITPTEGRIRKKYLLSTNIFYLIISQKCQYCCFPKGFVCIFLVYLFLLISSVTFYRHIIHLSIFCQKECWQYRERTDEISECFLRKSFSLMTHLVSFIWI